MNIHLLCWIGIHAWVYDDAKHVHCSRCTKRERQEGEPYWDLDVCDTRYVYPWVDDSDPPPTPVSIAHFACGLQLEDEYDAD